ncbi:restriction endonuclease subunit S [Pseudoalteromonas nigrifaciens]|uniref:restriction endonuclease subunit S n=1 Tax=Pseudoalteromonas nigrifaciens TaxID=28109 RepID=UPI003FD344F0
MSWPLVKLGEVCKFVRGPFGGALKKECFVEDGFAVYEQQHAIYNQFSEIRYFVDESKFNELKRFMLNPGDLIMSCSGTMGKIAIVPDNIKTGIINQALLKLTPSEAVDINYLKYWLESESFQFILNGMTHGAAIKNVASVAVLKEIEIPLPSIEEQKRIAAILDKADAIRRKRQQAIQLADDFLRSVFLDMFGDPISNPKGWEVKKLKEISSKISSGNTPKGGSKNYVDEGITFMRSQNVWKNKLLLDDVVYIDEKTHESMSKSSLKRKDILMTKTGRINTENSSLGRAALYLGEDGKANLNGHVYFIRLVENILHEFVVFILTTIEYRDYIRSVCVGGIDKRQLNRNHLEEFPIIYPPKKMQEQFVKKVNVARNMLEKAKSGLKESEQMFNGLSQKAFSGEL